MTWYWGLVDKATVKIESPDGNVTEMLWSDHKPSDGRFSDANGWCWDGDRPDAVYNHIVDNDIAAAMKDDIEQDGSRFNNLPAN